MIVLTYEDYRRYNDLMGNGPIRISESAVSLSSLQNGQAQSGQPQVDEHEFTRQQVERFAYASGRVVSKYKFFGALMAELEIIFTNKVPTACVDGTRMWVSPKFISTLTEKQIIFLIAHEVLHCAFAHFSRRGNRDPRRWNIAADLEINPTLIEDGIMSLQELKQMRGLYDVKFLGKGAEEIYEILYADKEEQERLEKESDIIDDVLDEQEGDQLDDQTQPEDKKKDQQKQKSDSKKGKPEDGEDGEGEDGEGEGEEDGDEGEGEGEDGQGEGEGEGEGDEGEEGTPGEGQGKGKGKKPGEKGQPGQGQGDGEGEDGEEGGQPGQGGKPGNDKSNKQKQNQQAGSGGGGTSDDYDDDSDDGMGGGDDGEGYESDYGDDEDDDYENHGDPNTGNKPNKNNVDSYDDFKNKQKDDMDQSDQSSKSVGDGQGEGEGRAGASADSDILDDEPTGPPKTSALNKDNVVAGRKKLSADDWANIAKKAAGEHGAGKGIRENLARLTKPKVNWKKELSRIIATASSDTEWIIPNRKYIAGGQYRYAEKEQENAFERVEIAIDISGSISDKEVQLFLNEITNLMKTWRIKYVDLIYFHHGVHAVDNLYLKPKFDMELSKARGGTNFKPWINHITHTIKREKKPVDLVIAFTDGENFDNPLDLPPWHKKMVWIVFNNFGYANPFGRKIEISTRDL